MIEAKKIQLTGGKIATFRSAIISDAKELLEYINLISGESDFLSFGVGEFSMTLEEEEAFIENVTKQETSLMLVVEVENKIIANLNFSAGRRPRLAHQGEFGISVAKAYWGEGIASKLLTFMIDWAHETGAIKKINLRTRSDNQSAIRLYKKFGFKEEGLLTREICIDNKFYDSILMGLTID